MATAVCIICREEDARVLPLLCDCRGSAGMHRKCRDAYHRSQVAETSDRMLETIRTNAKRGYTTNAAVRCRVCQAAYSVRAVLESRPRAALRLLAELSEDALRFVAFAVFVLIPTRWVASALLPLPPSVDWTRVVVGALVRLGAVRQIFRPWVLVERSSLRAMSLFGLILAIGAFGGYAGEALVATYAWWVPFDWFRSLLGFAAGFLATAVAGVVSKEWLSQKLDARRQIERWEVDSDDEDDG